MLSVVVVAVPAVMLVGWLCYQWFELELVVRHPVLSFVFSPFNYCVILSGLMSLMLSGLVVLEAKTHNSPLTRHTPDQSKRLETIEEDIEELQTAVADLKAMTQIVQKKKRS